MFSIIIPTYNRAYILAETLTSLQQQTFNEFEVIIVDDGSTDNTEEVCQPFLADPRFSLYKQPNLGVAAARQLGLIKAKAEVVTFIDSDDPVFVNYLQVLTKIFAENPEATFGISNCHFYVDLQDSAGNTLKSKHLVTHTEPVTLDDIYHWQKRLALGTGLFFKRTAFIDKVAWDMNFHCFEDLDMVLQLARLDPRGYHFQMQPTFEYHQRYGNDGLCSSMSYLKWSEAFSKLYEKHKDDPLLTEPKHYLDRIEKYKLRQQQFERGELVAPYLKYFPEMDVSGAEYN